MRKLLPGLLSFNGGFVDTAGFLGLQGLFTAHVTGNFVTLGAALVFGTHGVIGKLLALPEFVLVVVLARVIGLALRRRGLDATRSMPNERPARPTSNPKPWRAGGPSRNAMTIRSIRAATWIVPPRNDC
jgi:hypothetical protein